MKDQVQTLKNLGISVVTLSDIEEDVKAVEKGVFSRLWKSRGFLENRMMETNTNKQCRAKLCAMAVDEAHVIKAVVSYL